MKPLYAYIGLRIMANMVREAIRGVADDYPVWGVVALLGVGFVLGVVV